MSVCGCAGEFWFSGSSCPSLSPSCHHHSPPVRSFKVSAKTGENIKQACRTLVSQIVKNNEGERERAKQSELQDNDADYNQSHVSLGAHDHAGGEPKKGGCC